MTVTSAYDHDRLESHERLDPSWIAVRAVYSSVNRHLLRLTRSDTLETASLEWRYRYDDVSEWYILHYWSALLAQGCILIHGRVKHRDSADRWGTRENVSSNPEGRGIIP